MKLLVLCEITVLLKFSLSEGGDALLLYRTEPANRLKWW